MSEDLAERAAELAMDRLDARLMSGELSQAEYDAEVRKLDDEVAKLNRVHGTLSGWLRGKP